MRKAKRNYEKSIGTEATHNPKQFWSHVRSKLKTKTGVAPLLENPKDKSSTKTKDKDIANILQNRFLSVFTNEPNDDLPEFKPRTDKSISSIEVSSQTVREKILKLNENKACRPDKIHP